MKVFVTGANGFIGRNLLEALATMPLAPKVTTMSMRDSDRLPELIQDTDFVFHLAAVMRNEDETVFQKVNVDLTKAILAELAKSTEQPRLLFTSSIQAELDTIYGRTKRAAEEAVMAWSRQHNHGGYVYRLPNIFGKWSIPNYSSVVATFAYNISHDLPIKIHNPDHIMTLAYIDDVIKVFLGHLTTPDKSAEGLYTIAGTTDISLQDLAELLYFFHENGSPHPGTSRFEKNLFRTYEYFKTQVEENPNA